MVNKVLPFSKEDIKAISKKFPTPFHIYDEEGIVINARRLNKAFSWNSGFKEYFAVKATPNPSIMSLLHNQGFGMDCSSLGELLLCERVRISGEDIMFTSNNTKVEEFRKALELEAILNLDDITHIDFLEKHLHLPELLCFRYNPGPLREGNTIIGNPEEAKYGLTRDQMFEAYKIAKEKGVKRFGMHTMIASNELDYKYFVETAKMLFTLANEISNKIGISFDFVNLGGGIGVPYKPEQKEVNLEKLSEEVQQVYSEMLTQKGLRDIKVYMENGRMITGPYGYLVTQAIHEKKTYKEYVGVDACMANLMRPGMYGAYHDISVLGKEGSPATHTYDVVGSLCENNDKFAIDRNLPEIENGDFVVVHDAGAHGHAMGFQYNAKLRSAELLLHKDKSVTQIRRAENYNDYFATLDF